MCNDLKEILRLEAEVELLKKQVEDLRAAQEEAVLQASLNTLMELRTTYPEVTGSKLIAVKAVKYATGTDLHVAKEAYEEEFGFLEEFEDFD